MINWKFFSLGFLCCLILQLPLSSPFKAVLWLSGIWFCVVYEEGIWLKDLIEMEGRGEPLEWQTSLTWLNCGVSWLEFRKMALKFPRIDGVHCHDYVIYPSWKEEPQSNPSH